MLAPIENEPVNPRIIKSKLVCREVGKRAENPQNQDILI